MEKIATLDIEIPLQLQWKVWMTLHLQFAQRGNENDDSMKKEDILITNENGLKVLRLRDYLTKNHRGSDLTKFSEGMIVATGTEDCSILMIEFYLSHLNPDCNFLWQRPRNSFEPEDDIWFMNSKCGHNTMTSMMKRISNFLKLSKIYTNHSVRSTSITLLGHSFQDNDIRAVSGHKSLVALGIYKRTSDETLANMSRTLHTHMTPKRLCHDSQTSITSADIPCSSSCSTPSFVAPMEIPLSSSEDNPTDVFQEIQKVCTQSDSRVFSQFSPHMQNCSNITFNFHFHK
jgi:hypothetical protein